VTDTLEHQARKIAEGGRDALLARLRPAFEQAAATHGEGLDLDDEQLERMVQRAADRADGLQWRRALAQVATDHLGIGLGEALGHPAVVRAQAIVGAPSYEDALGELETGASKGSSAAAKPAAEPEPTPEPESKAETTSEPESKAETKSKAKTTSEPESKAEATDEPASEPQEPVAQTEEPEAQTEEPVAAEEPEGAQEPEAAVEPEAQPEEPTPEPAAEAEPEEPAAAVAPVPAPTTDGPAAAATNRPIRAGAPDALRLRAVHLGGIANLKPAEGDLELHLSDAGLDIVRGPERVPLGRLTWPEIVALEAPVVGGRFRRKRPTDAHLVVRSAQGSASFEIPGVTTEELQEHLAPVLAQHQS
jgi:hypothetical protein